MPLVPIDMTPAQRQALKDFQKKAGIKNVSEYIRGLIRADMWEHSIEFPPDAQWGGGRSPQSASNKQTLLGDLLARLNDSIPVLVADMTTSTDTHLQSLITDFEGRTVLPDLLAVVKEAHAILQEQGYLALMGWFGIVPLVDAETRLTIEATRIKSIEEE